MKFLGRYICSHKKVIIALILFCFVFLIVFYFYDLPIMAVLYPIIICIFIGLTFFIYDFCRAYVKHKYLLIINSQIEYINDISLNTETQDDIDYKRIVFNLQERLKKLEGTMNSRYSDMMDYYTIWVHQIKTPIASIKLNLENNNSELSKLLSNDLFRIEQYVEMVLCYLRLNSESTDYIIKEYDLDTIIKSSVKKFASQFIHKKTKLNYCPINISVITDEKWLSFVFEQIISNALKYTQRGSISIYLENPKTLCISDTGIGIAKEDLPRIFEKGYTGYNGRSNKKASGIGLYLCKRICNNLGHTISVESCIDKGTTIKINFEQEILETE